MKTLSDFQKDLRAIREILGLSQKELALELGVTNVTISLWEAGKTAPTSSKQDEIYDFAFKRDVRLNEAKAQLFMDASNQNTSILFHGAKIGIDFPLDLKHSKRSNDLGPGFYAGEGYEQAATYVAAYPFPTLYAFSFANSQSLRVMSLDVNFEWMIAVAYFRGYLKAYGQNEAILSLARKIEESDLIIAPIADNSMYEIIGSFATGQITDEQCKHSLAANHLGKQYVFKSERAINDLKLIFTMRICPLEKKELLAKKAKATELGLSKVNLAKIEYRGKGRYVEELFHA